MGTIFVNDIKVYAHHGCMPEERRIGSDYIVNIEVKADLSKSAITDNLEDTVDYVSINQIVKDQMAISSNLLEHVAQRIINAIIEKHDEVREVVVDVSKINPPINGDVKSVTVKQSFKTMPIKKID